MITIEDAEKIIKQHMPRFQPISLPLSKAVGHVLYEDVFTSRPIPPFDRVMMDGIALKASALKENKIFKVEATQASGEPQRILKNSRQGCLQVMTGSMLPQHCDCVIPFEEIELFNHNAKIKEPILHKKGQYIHPKGSDRDSGTRLVKKGTLLSSAHMLVLAGAGQALLRVLNLPSIAVLSNGNELVALGEDPEAHQIHPVGTYGVISGFKKMNFQRVEHFHFPDDPEILTRGLAHILAQFEVVILSGGVSMGTYDFIPKVLEKLNVKNIFHRIRQRPGKPFWFGKAENDCIVFGLPGNPVSTMFCFYRFVLPAFFPMRAKKIGLAESIENNTELTCFYPVRIMDNIAHQVPFNGSGDYAALAESDGFIEVKGGIHKEVDFWSFLS